MLQMNTIEVVGGHCYGYIPVPVAELILCKYWLLAIYIPNAGRNWRMLLRVVFYLSFIESL